MSGPGTSALQNALKPEGARPSGRHLKFRSTRALGRDRSQYSFQRLASPIAWAASTFRSTPGWYLPSGAGRKRRNCGLGSEPIRCRRRRATLTGWRSAVALTATSSTDHSSPGLDPNRSASQRRQSAHLIAAGVSGLGAARLHLGGPLRSAGSTAREPYFRPAQGQPAG